MASKQPVFCPFINGECNKNCMFKLKENKCDIQEAIITLSEIDNNTWNTKGELVNLNARVSVLEDAFFKKRREVEGDPESIYDIFFKKAPKKK